MGKKLKKNVATTHKEINQINSEKHQTNLSGTILSNLSDF